jgi:preprotein translocase SecE subunit
MNYINQFFAYVKSCKAEILHIKFPSRKEIYAKLIGVFIISSAFAISFMVVDVIIRFVLRFLYL